MGGGGYLLLVLNPPWSPDHKESILQRVAKGLLSWDVKATGTDLSSAEKTCLSVKVSAGPHNELLIQHSTDSLALEVLLNPEVSTFRQCFKNMMISGTTHKHVIHAGYAFGGSGDWILRDGVFGCQDLEAAIHEPEVEQVLRKQRFHTLHVHCSPEGSWRQPPVGVSLNPPDIVDQLAGSNHLLSCLDTVLTSPPLTSLLPSSSVVGNIRFRRPTMYVFPGGQGDCALFGVTGFTLLVDGGFARKPCFWEFVRHLDRLDSLLVTRFNQFNSCGLTALAQRKALERVYPQVGHVFFNAVKSPSDEELQKDRDQLVVSVVAQGLEFLQGVREMGLAPQACHQDQHPLTLYHKVGHGTLEMYVLSPGRVTDEDSSVCVLLVWRPAKVSEPVTRILLPGSATQSVIFDGLKKLSHLAVLKSRAVTAETRIGLKRPKVQEKRAASVPPRPGVARRATGKVESPSPSPTPPEKPKAATRVKANKPAEHTTRKQLEEQKKTAPKADRKEPKKTAIDRIVEQVGEKKEDKLSVNDEVIENIMDKNNIVEALAKKDPDDILDKELTNIITDKTLEKTKDDPRKTGATEPTDQQKLMEKASAKRQVKKVPQPKPVAKSKGAKDVTNKKTVEAKSVARKVMEPTKAKPRPAVTPPTKPLVRESRSKSPASSTSSSPKHATSKSTPERPVRSVRGGARTAKQALTALEGAADADRALPKAGEKPTAQVKPDKRIELVSQSADESSTSREAIEEKAATEATKEEKPSFEGVLSDESHKETVEADQLEEPLPKAPDKLHVQADIGVSEEVVVQEDGAALQVIGTEERLPEQKPSDDKGDEMYHVPSPEPTVSASSEGVPSLEDEVLEISPRDDASVPPCTLEADLSRVRALSSGQRTPDSLDTPREVGDGTAPSTEQDILAAMEKHKLVSGEHAVEMKRRDSLDSIEGEVLMEQEEAVLLPGEELLKDQKMTPVYSEQAQPVEAESDVHQLKETYPSTKLNAPFDSTVDSTQSSTEPYEEKPSVTPEVAEVQKQSRPITPPVTTEKELNTTEAAPLSEEKLLANSQVNICNEKEQEIRKRDQRPSVIDHELREDEGNKKATAKFPLLTDDSLVPHSRKDYLLSDDHEMQDDGFKKETKEALDKEEPHKEDNREAEEQISASREEAEDIQRTAGVSGEEVIPGAEDRVDKNISADELREGHETLLTTRELEDASKEHPPLLEPKQLVEKEMSDVHEEPELGEKFREPEIIGGKIFPILQPDDGSFSSESLVERDFMEHAKGKDEEEQKADESLGDVCDIPEVAEVLNESERKPGDVLSRTIDYLPIDENAELCAEEPPLISHKYFQETSKYLTDEPREPSKPGDHEHEGQEITPTKSERKESPEVMTAVTEHVHSDSKKQHSSEEEKISINEPDLSQEKRPESSEKPDSAQAKKKPEIQPLPTEPSHVDETGREREADIGLFEIRRKSQSAEHPSYAVPDKGKDDLQGTSLLQEGSSPTAPDSGIYEEITEFPSKQPEMPRHENYNLPERGTTKGGDASPTLERKETTSLELPEMETAKLIDDKPDPLVKHRTESQDLRKSADLEPKQADTDAALGEREIAQDEEQEPNKIVVPKQSDDKAVESDDSQRQRFDHDQYERPQPTEAEKIIVDISKSSQSETPDTLAKKPIPQDKSDGRDYTCEAGIVPRAVTDAEEDSKTADSEPLAEKHTVLEFGDEILHSQKGNEINEAPDLEHELQQEDKPFDPLHKDLENSMREDTTEGDFYKPKEDMRAQDKDVPQTEKRLGNERQKTEEPRKLEETSPGATTSLGDHHEDSSAVTQVTPSQQTFQKGQSPERGGSEPLLLGQKQTPLTEASDSSQARATAPDVETLSLEEDKRPAERSDIQSSETDAQVEQESKPTLEAHDKVPEEEAAPYREKIKTDDEQQDGIAPEESPSRDIPEPRTPHTKEKVAPEAPARAKEPSSRPFDETPEILGILSEEKAAGKPRLVEDFTIWQKDSDTLQQGSSLVREDALKATTDLVDSSPTILGLVEETQPEIAPDKSAERKDDVSAVETVTPSIAASQEAVPPVRKKRELADDEDRYFHPVEKSEGDISDEASHLKATKKPRKDLKPDDEACAVSGELRENGEESQANIEKQNLVDDSVLDSPSVTARTLPELVEEKKRDYSAVHGDLSGERAEIKEVDCLQHLQLAQYPELQEKTASRDKLPQDISGEEKPLIGQMDLHQKDYEHSKDKIIIEPSDTSDLDKHKPPNSAVEDVSGDIARQTSQLEQATQEASIPSKPEAVEKEEKLVVCSPADQNEFIVSSQAPTTRDDVIPREMPLTEAGKQDLSEAEAEEKLPELVCLSKHDQSAPIQKDLDRDDKAVAIPYGVDIQNQKQEDPKDSCHKLADKFSPAETENEAFTDKGPCAQEQQEEIFEDVDNTSSLPSETTPQPPFPTSEAKEQSCEETSKQPDEQHHDQMPGVPETNVQADLSKNDENTTLPRTTSEDVVEEPQRLRESEPSGILKEREGIVQHPVPFAPPKTSEEAEAALTIPTSEQAQKTDVVEVNTDVPAPEKVQEVDWECHKLRAEIIVGDRKETAESQEKTKLVESEPESHAPEPVVLLPLKATLVGNKKPTTLDSLRTKSDDHSEGSRTIPEKLIQRPHDQIDDEVLLEDLKAFKESSDEVPEVMEVSFINEESVNIKQKLELPLTKSSEHETTEEDIVIAKEGVSTGFDFRSPSKVLKVHLPETEKDLVITEFFAESALLQDTSPNEDDKILLESLKKEILDESFVQKEIFASHVESYKHDDVPPADSFKQLTGKAQTDKVPGDVTEQVEQEPGARMSSHGDRATAEEIEKIDPEDGTDAHPAALPSAHVNEEQVNETSLSTVPADLHHEDAHKIPLAKHKDVLAEESSLSDSKRPAAVPPSREPTLKDGLIDNKDGVSPSEDSSEHPDDQPQVATLKGKHGEEPEEQQKEQPFPGDDSSSVMDTTTKTPGDIPDDGTILRQSDSLILDEEKQIILDKKPLDSSKELPEETPERPSGSLDSEMCLHQDDIGTCISDPSKSYETLISAPEIPADVAEVDQVSTPKYSQNLPVSGFTEPMHEIQPERGVPVAALEHDEHAALDGVQVTVEDKDEHSRDAMKHPPAERLLNGHDTESLELVEHSKYTKPPTHASKQEDSTTVLPDTKDDFEKVSMEAPFAMSVKKGSDDVMPEILGKPLSDELPDTSTSHVYREDYSKTSEKMEPCHREAVEDPSSQILTKLPDSISPKSEEVIIFSDVEAVQESPKHESDIKHGDIFNSNQQDVKETTEARSDICETVLAQESPMSESPAKEEGIAPAMLTDTEGIKDRIPLEVSETGSDKVPDKTGIKKFECQPRESELTETISLKTADDAHQTSPLTSQFIPDPREADTILKETAEARNITLTAGEHVEKKTKAAVLSNGESELLFLPKPMPVPHEDLTSGETSKDVEKTEENAGTDLFTAYDSKSTEETTEGHVPGTQASKIGFIANLVEQGVEEVRDWIRTSVHKDQIQKPDSTESKEDAESVLVSERPFDKSDDDMSKERVPEANKPGHQDELQKGISTSTEDEKDIVVDDRRSLEKTTTETADMASENVKPSKKKEQALATCEAPLPDQTDTQQININYKHEKDEHFPEGERHQTDNDVEYPDTSMILTRETNGVETPKHVTGREVEDYEGRDNSVHVTEEVVAHATFPPKLSEPFLPTAPDEPTAVDSQELLTQRPVSGNFIQPEAPWGGHTDHKAEGLKDPSVEIIDQPVKDPRASICLTTEDPAFILSHKRSSLEYDESSITSVSDMECGPEDKSLRAHPPDSGSEASEETDVADDGKTRSSPGVSSPTSPVERIPRDKLHSPKEVCTRTESKPPILTQESSQADISSDEEDNTPKEPENIESTKVEEASSKRKHPLSIDDILTAEDLPPIYSKIPTHAGATTEGTEEICSNGMAIDERIHHDVSPFVKAASNDAAQQHPQVKSAPDEPCVTRGEDDEIQAQNKASIVPRKLSTSFGSTGLAEEVCSEEYRGSGLNTSLTKTDKKGVTHKREGFSAHKDTNEESESFTQINKTAAAEPGELGELKSNLDSFGKDITDDVAQTPLEHLTVHQHAEKSKAASDEDFTASKQTEPSTIPVKESVPVRRQMQDDRTSSKNVQEQKFQIGSLDKDIPFPSFPSVSAKDIEILDDYTKRLALTRDDRVSVDSIFSLTSEERSYTELERPDHEDELAHGTHEGTERDSFDDNKDRMNDVFKTEDPQEEILPKHLDQANLDERDVEKDGSVGLPSLAKIDTTPVEPESSLAAELARTEKQVKGSDGVSSDNLYASTVVGGGGGIPESGTENGVCHAGKTPTMSRPSTAVASTTSDKERDSECEEDEVKNIVPEFSSEVSAQVLKSPTYSEVPQHGIVSGLLAALRTELCVIDSTDLLKESVLDEAEKIVTSESEKTPSDSVEHIVEGKTIEGLKPSGKLTPSPGEDSRGPEMGTSEHATYLEKPHEGTDQSMITDETTTSAKEAAVEKPSGVDDVCCETTQKEPGEKLCGAGTVTETGDESEHGDLKKEEAAQVKVIRFQLHDEHSVKSGLKKPLSLIPEDSATPSTTFTTDGEDDASTLFEQAVRLEQSHEAAFLEGAGTDEEESSLKLSHSDYQDDITSRTQSIKQPTQAVIVTGEEVLEEEGPTLAAALSRALPTELVCIAQSSSDIQKDISTLTKKMGLVELETPSSHTQDIEKEEEPVAVAVGLASGLPIELVCVMESKEVCSEIKRAGEEAAHRASEKIAELTDSEVIYPELDDQTSMVKDSQSSKVDKLVEDRIKIEGDCKEPFLGKIDTGKTPHLSPKVKPGEMSGRTQHVDAMSETHEHGDHSPSDAKPPLSPSVGLVAGLAAGLATELVCIPQSVEGICMETLEGPPTEVMTHGVVMGSSEVTDARNISAETVQDPKMHSQQPLTKAGHTDEDRLSLRHATIVPGTHRVVTTTTTYRVGHASEEQPDGLMGHADVFDRALPDDSERSSVTYAYRTDDSTKDWEWSSTTAPGSFAPDDGGIPTRLISSNVLEFQSPAYEEHKENGQVSGVFIRRQVYEVPADRDDQETPISRSDDSGISFPDSSIQKVAMEEVARITELAASTFSESFNGKFSMRASDSSAQRPLELVRPVRPAEREDERNVTHGTQVRQVAHHPSSSSEIHFPMGYPAEETCLPPEGSDPQTILQFMAAQTKQAAKEMLEEQPLYEEDEECALEQSSTSDASPLVEEPVFAKTLRPDYPELVELSGGNTPSEPPSPRSPFDPRTKPNGEPTSSVQRMVVIEESEPPSSPSRTHIERIVRRVEGPVTEIHETWTLQGDVAGLQALPEGSSRILLGSVQQSETSIESQVGDTTGFTRAHDRQGLPRVEQDVVQQASWKTTVVETRQVAMPGETTIAGSDDDGITAFRGVPEEQNGNKGDASFNIHDWGKPLGLPVLPEPPRSYDTSSSKTSRTKKAQQGDVVYVDLTYVPHHGDPAYCDVEFFNRVRARYYVLSGTSPSQEVLNALLEAKRGWGDPDVPVTVIPTYETDALCYWIALNQKALEEQKIDVAPSASRCTINLQDHESSCAAYRLEF